MKRDLFTTALLLLMNMLLIANLFVMLSSRPRPAEAATRQCVGIAEKHDYQWNSDTRSYGVKSSTLYRAWSDGSVDSVR